MKRASLAALVIAAALAMSCSQFHGRSDETPQIGPPLCTENFVAGLILEVRDAISGVPAAYGAEGEIRDGSYSEILQVVTPPGADPTMALTLIGAWERQGVYSVTVRKTGYQNWTGTAVVEGDACHVHTTTLQVNLQR